MIWLALLMLVQADPDQARFEQAQQLASQGRCREAIPVFRQLADAHPSIAAIPFALGQCEFEVFLPDFQTATRQTITAHARRRDEAAAALQAVDASTHRVGIRAVFVAEKVKINTIRRTQ